VSLHSHLTISPHFKKENYFDKLKRVFFVLRLILIIYSPPPGCTNECSYLHWNLQGTH